MTQEESFQELKKSYIFNAEAHVKALSALTLDDYLATDTFYSIATLRNCCANSSINLCAFILTEAADRRDKKIKKMREMADMMRGGIA